MSIIDIYGVRYIAIAAGGGYYVIARFDIIPHNLKYIEYIGERLIANKYYLGRQTMTRTQWLYVRNPFYQKN